VFSTVSALGYLMNHSLTLFDEAAAARLLNVSQRTLQRWRNQGSGPAYTRVGPRLIGYRLADVEAWTASRVHPSLAAEMHRAIPVITA
jgi:predicted DNA-binding transcriptional regulator AlpA